MPTEFDISGLSPSECILLAERLWERARARPDAVAVTQAQRGELKRRVEALDSGDMLSGEPWEAVRERLFPR